MSRGAGLAVPFPGAWRHPAAVSERQQTRALLGQPWPGGHLERDELRASVEGFLQAGASPDERRDRGLDAVLRGVFPIKDFGETAELSYIDYTLTQPREAPDDCRRRGQTYAGDLRIRVYLIIYEQGTDGQRMVRNIKEQEVFLTEIPALTPEGTFVINGVDRVIVRQLSEAPGVRFVLDDTGRMQAQIRPQRGSRLAFELDKKRLVWARIDGRRGRVPATTLLRAMGLNSEEMLAHLCPIESYEIEPGGVFQRVDPTTLIGQRASRDLVVDGEVIIKRHRKFLRATLRRMAALNVTRLKVDEDDLWLRTLARDVIDPRSGEVIREVGDMLEGALATMRQRGITGFELVYADGITASSSLLDTLRADKVRTSDDALLAFYRALRPGDAPTVETARHLFERLFFSEERFDLSLAGRRSLNRKLHASADEPPIAMSLTIPDVLETLRELLRRDVRREQPDDLEHAGEAVVRDAASLIGYAIRSGLMMIERATKERMSIVQDIEAMMPHDLLNGRPLRRVLDEFFGWSRVSERADFNSPLAEQLLRRRLTVSEPNQKSLKRAGYRLTGQHDSHLGIFCPVERPVIGGAAPALSCRTDEAGMLRSASQPLTHLGDPEWAPPQPWEALGLGAALVPFLSHDAHETAADGIASMRAALPPICSEPPLVGTGLEAEVAHSSGLTLLADVAGTVVRATCREVVVRADDATDDEAATRVSPLRRHQPSARGARLHQRPAVRVGQRVAPGDLLATGPGVVAGELALGHNLLTALLPGDTFDCSLIVSERVLRDGLFTTLHLHTYQSLAVSAGFTEETFTSQLPGVDPEDTARLDERGLIRPGSRVRSGDLLVGKPRVDPRVAINALVSMENPDEDASLEASLDVSLRLPPGREGVVLDARIETRREVTLPKRTGSRARVVVATLQPLSVGDLLGSRHGERGTVARIAPVEDMPVMPDGRPVDLLLNPSLLLERCAAGTLMELLAGALGVPTLAPPFAPVTEAQLRARLGGDGRVWLRDGKTGETLDHPATVGILYMMKLPPLASDTMEVRSTGAYDPRTEQPAASHADPGGQLIDEGDVAALLAHGAAYNLRELLGSKSDDAAGRAELQAALLTGDEVSGAVPQSLDALFRELRACALHTEAAEHTETAEPPPTAPPTPAPPADSRRKPGKRARSGRTQG